MIKPNKNSLGKSVWARVYGWIQLTLALFGMVSLAWQVYQVFRPCLFVTLGERVNAERQLTTQVVFTNTSTLLPVREVAVVVCPSSKIDFERNNVFDSNRSTSYPFALIPRQEVQEVPIGKLLGLVFQVPVLKADVNLVIRYKRAFRTFYLQKHFVGSSDGDVGMRFYDRTDAVEHEGTCGL